MPYTVFAQAAETVTSLAGRIGAARAPGLVAMTALRADGVDARTASASAVSPEPLRDTRAAAEHPKGWSGITWLDVESDGTKARFSVIERPVLPDDLERARRAEIRGRAAGMATLAARCSTVWVLTAPDDAPEWLVLEACARLAFAALGPVLPPGEETLLGVRSARERAERLR